MKRFLVYCMVVVTLFLGVKSTSVRRNSGSLLHIESHLQKESLPEQHKYSFSSVDLLVSIGMGNEQIRLNHSSQYLSTRIISSLTNTFRISHSGQLAFLQYLNGCTAFSLKSAFKQLDGYYLYYLRKLLI